MTQQTMLAAVLEKPLHIEMKRINVPTPAKDEALVKVKCIGVCGSDVHYYEHGKIGRYVVEKPIVLGHELAGEIVQVGSEVSHLKVGDRVAVEPGVTCGKCDYCKGGRYNLCPDVVFLATPPVDGAWTEYITIRADFLFKLPNSMSFEQGALIEPLSVGFHAMQRAKVKPSDRLLITGLGPIGLLAIQAAKLFGVQHIYVTDIVPFRKELALEMGATAVIDPSQDNVVERLLQLTNGEGVSVVIESSGNKLAIADTVKSVKRGGRVVFIGMPTTDEIPLNVNTIIDSELDIYGVFRYANTYPSVITALSSSNLDIEKVITHKFPLSQTNAAVEVARLQKDSSIKVMIYPE